MRRDETFLGFALALSVWLLATLDNRAQPRPPDFRASDFSMDMYFEPPNEQKVKMRFAGAESKPVAGGLLMIKQLKLEVFSTNGSAQLIAQAPSCTIAPLDAQAYSAEHLTLRSGDGRLHLEGDGFLIAWREEAMSLTLSNRVKTLLQTGFLNP